MIAVQPCGNIIEWSVNVTAHQVGLFTNRRTANKMTGRRRPLITWVTSNTELGRFGMTAMAAPRPKKSKTPRRLVLHENCGRRLSQTSASLSNKLLPKARPAASIEAPNRAYTERVSAYLPAKRINARAAVCRPVM